MSTGKILNFKLPNGFAFSLKQKPDEDLTSLRVRAAKKADLSPSAREDLTLKYEHDGSLFSLDDDDDLEIFQSRVQRVAEPTIHITHHSLSSLPSHQHQHQHHFSHSAHPGPSHFAPPPPAPAAVGTALEPAERVDSPGASVRSGKSWRKKAAAPLPTVNGAGGGEQLLAHKQAFNEFHASNGVRVLTGDIGNVKDVRMLLRSGWRHIYMSRSFAKRHQFIPRDAAPGSFGYLGLTNLGTWPIRVGSKTVEHPVYLSEMEEGAGGPGGWDIVLGRAFVEKRRVKLSNMDMTSVVLGDTGENVECDVVVVRDAATGREVSIS